MVLKPFVRHKIKRRRRRKIFSYYIVLKNAFWEHIFEKNFEKIKNFFKTVISVVLNSIKSIKRHKKTRLEKSLFM